MDRAATATHQARSVGLCALLFFATVLLFARTLGNGFVNYDDPTYILANANVQRGLSWSGLRWALTANVSANWHPLTLVSHEIDWSLFGRKAAGHHAVSVLWHALNVVLVFLVFRQMRLGNWLSAGGAAYWAWHPLRVESVAWISERKDVLSGFLALLSLWSYLAAHAPGGNGRRHRGLLALSLVAYALGLAAKPMLVTLPAVMLLLDVWPLERPLRKRGVWIEKLPYLVLAGASSVVTYLSQSRGGSVSVTRSLGVRCANAAVALPRYVGKIAWPVHLAPLYPYRADWPAPAVAASVLGAAAVTLWVIMEQRRRPWFAVGWLWFVGMLVPVAGVVQVGLQSMADRYTYLPSLGFELVFLAAAQRWCAAERARPGRIRIAGTAVAAVLAACAALTWRQIGYWRDSGTLWRHTINVTGRNAVAYNNLGTFLQDQGDLGQALPNYRTAVAIDPDYPEANTNLGQALTSSGEPAESLPYLRRALALNPALTAAQVDLGDAFMGLGRLDAAIQEFRQVLDRHPATEQALREYGMALALQGHPAEAASRLQEASALDPSDAAAHGDLGMVYADLSRWNEAIAEDRAAVALRPTEEAGRYNLGAALQRTGRLAEAESEFRAAIRLAPEDPDAHASLGFTLMQEGRKAEAAAEFRVALRQNPGLSQVREWLGHLEPDAPK